MRKLAAAAALGLLGGALALAGPASAHTQSDEEPNVAVDRSRTNDCGTQTFTTAWAPDARQVDNTMLVVQVVGTGRQIVAGIGETITVGPFTGVDDEQVTIRWRVWGGAERDHDDPPLTNLDALLAYLETHPGGELDADPPGVAWRNRTVHGCPAEPTPAPTTPSETEPPGGEGGEADDDKGLPVTGVSTGIMVGSAVALLVVGGGLYLVARRRRTSFTS